MGKNVAVFVDVANIFYAAKAAGTDIDYVTLLKAATAGRDFVRAYAYTGLDPENENQRNFHAFLARNHYKVVSKDIRKYGDGKVKANLDIELVVDLMKTARNLDIAIVISGDGDFAPAIRAVQEMGVRVEVISFRGNTSSDLIEVADLFTDITQLARVDKSSTRSGRRVAVDDEDLSMTEVPDKQTEGSGARGRGRGRGRSRPGEAEPVAARSRSGGRVPSSAAAVAAPVGVMANAGAMTVMPGEKLSRIAPPPAAGEAGVEDEAVLEPLEAAEPVDDQAAEGEDGARRRRRRRGGRGRGRGRGREDGQAVLAADGAPGDEGFTAEDEEEEEQDAAAPGPAPRGPRTTPFGSVWDAQIGVPSAAPAASGPVTDDEDYEEPEIPEYLIAEQRRGRQQPGGRSQGGRGGPRGGRSAYTAAIDRERYGRGGGVGSGGLNRYPDVSGRDRQGGRGPTGGQGSGGFGRPERQDRSERPDRFERPAPRSGGDPWTEVPPELEQMLRAQLAQSPKGRRPEASAPRRPAAPGESVTPTPAAATATSSGETTAPTRRRSTTRRTAGRPAEAATATPAAAGPAEPGEPTAPKRRVTRSKATAGAAAPVEATIAPAPAADRAPAPAKRATKPRATRAPAATAARPAGKATPSPEADGPAPKRRTTRKKVEPA